MLEWEEAVISSWEQESSSHPGSTTCQQVFIIHFSNQQKPVFLMHDTLVWIRIRGSMALTKWILIRIMIFSSVTFQMPAKN